MGYLPTEGRDKIKANLKKVLTGSGIKYSMRTDVRGLRFYILKSDKIDFIA